MTRRLFCNNRSAKFEPINPAPPVTRIDVPMLYFNQTIRFYDIHYKKLSIDILLLPSSILSRPIFIKRRLHNQRLFKLTTDCHHNLIAGFSKTTVQIGQSNTLFQYRGL